MPLYYFHSCKLISPDFVLEELYNNKGDIINLEANKISPHNEETKDDPYFALALALNSPIWSDEEAFKHQSRIKVFNTKELSELLDKYKSCSENNTHILNI